MKHSIKIGDVYEHKYIVPLNKTVPYLYPESEEYQKMPEVFATGFMVGLLEWCCIEALKPHLDDNEGSLGTFIKTTHSAPTPPGMEIRVIATCKEIKNGNNIFWEVVAFDEMEEIARGEHGRHIIDKDRFNSRVLKKKNIR
ncbi:MAG: thioesterase family protein [Thermodesulfobacteriota bacterium]